MARERPDNNGLMDVQINGKKARDCTPDECELIGEFYYKLTELQTIAERLCPYPINVARLVFAEPIEPLRKPSASAAKILV